LLLGEWSFIADVIVCITQFLPRFDPELIRKDRFMRLGISTLSNLGFLIGSCVVFAPALGESPSSPAELAQTAQLNRDMAAQGRSSNADYASAKKKYDEDKRENEAQVSHYQEEVKQNQALQDQYQEKLKDYQRTYEKTKSD
jgi:hypothetical protein